MTYLTIVDRVAFILPNWPDKHKNIVNINTIEYIHTLGGIMAECKTDKYGMIINGLKY
jgi:hypothetical protein